MAGIPLTTLQRMSMEGDRQATSILDRFERRYLWHIRQARQYRESMAHEPSMEGRGAGTVPGTVNGTETRVSRRWQSTPIDAVRVPVRDAEGRVTGFTPMDRTVYVVAPDGSRVPWVDPTVPDAAPVARRTVKTDAAARLASLARMGIVPDTSLASGDA